MPVVKVYRNGSKAVYFGDNTGGDPPTDSVRGEIAGWSPDAARRNTLFLMSVATERLTGSGFAYTLTMRETPGSSEEYLAAMEFWRKAVMRSGAIRLHWVVEWQTRGTPHVHCAVYYPEGATVAQRDAPAEAWFRYFRRWGVGAQAQYYTEIDRAVGWLKYMAKHAARGAMHYQRVGFPEGWDKSGRLWGHRGAWPIGDLDEFELSDVEFVRFRRLVSAYRVAQERALSLGRKPRTRRAQPGDARKDYARRAQRVPENARMWQLGVSTWIDRDAALLLVWGSTDRGRRFEVHTLYTPESLAERVRRYSASRVRIAVGQPVG